MLSDLATRLHGSEDIYLTTGRPVSAGINFITSHDGFTLNDLVSYEHRHNEANGENNQDGHAHNFSCNYGAEGPVEDPAIRQVRRQQRLNMLACLLLSRGTPMLLAGDEFGNTQAGNNNAYAQDNETGWLDWGGLASDPDFLDQVQTLLALRRQLSPWGEFSWLSPAGAALDAGQWQHGQALTMLMSKAPEPGETGADTWGYAMLINAADGEQEFHLPDIEDGAIRGIVFCSAPVEHKGQTWTLAGRSVACLSRECG